MSFLWSLYLLFYRCGHCKRLAPEYESAASELALNNPPVPLAKVDATVETSLANRFGIDGYPTLKVFHQGTPYDYEGPRTAQGKSSKPCVAKSMQYKTVRSWSIDILANCMQVYMYMHVPPFWHVHSLLHPLSCLYINGLLDYLHSPNLHTTRLGLAGKSLYMTCKVSYN